MNKTSLFLTSSLAGLLLFGAPQALNASVATPDVTKKIVITATLHDSKQDAADKAAIDADAADSDDSRDSGHEAKAGSDNAVVSIGHDSNLASGEHAAAVVSVLGSSTSAGEVDAAVVSVLGNTRVTGPVGEAAVAVLGSTSVDSKVKGEVVAVFGDVELGPNADVGGDVVVVGGTLHRDPAAIVHGNVQQVVLFGAGGHLEWLHTWVKHCLVYGRPLAIAPGLGWAWGFAFTFFALYLLIALLFPKGIEQCVRTMEEQPGRSVLASILTVLAKPIVFVLLVVTVIGIALVPFLALGLFVAGLFGKAVALAWIGRRILGVARAGATRPPVLSVLIGGVVVLLLYMVPVLGFVLYKTLAILGLGIVVYTLILNSRGAREAAAAARSAATPDTGAAAAMASPDASTAAGPGTAEPAATPAAAAPATAAAPSANASMERAGFWIRMTGLALDVIIVAIACAILPFIDFDGPHKGFLVLLAGYAALMWKLKGSTIGGFICRLQVVRLDGRAIDWPTAVARALGCFLSLVVAGLGFLWIVFDADRQSWHDKIAGTVVVRVPRGASLV
ncbi:MAG: RDD family protein [Steroidobacteraceae bacterium]